MILMDLAHLQSHVDGREKTMGHVRSDVKHHAVNALGERFAEFGNAAIPAGDAVTNLAPSLTGDEIIQFDRNALGGNALGDVYYLSGNQRNILAHFWLFMLG